MTNAIAIRAQFNKEDIANARAYALAMGEQVGTRGRLEQVHLDIWHRALRPQIVSKPVSGVGRGKHTGKRGGSSTVNVEGATSVVSKADARNARLWAVENGHAVPARGRLSVATLQGWADDGMPDYREQVATVYARKLDKRGRPNGKEIAIPVYRDELSRAGKPRMVDYVNAVAFPILPVRIVAGAMLIDVTKDDDGSLSYAWVSKADGKGVVDMLKAHINI
jgi:hypothetical protein